MTRALRRWRRAGVTELPVWNLPVQGGLLWERLGAPRVEALRASGPADTAIGAELAASAADAIRRLRDTHGFDRVYLAGGLASSDGFAHALARLDGGVMLDPDGRFAGERGGLALLAERGHEGAVVDVGQTGIKASLRGRRLVRERDTRLLPFQLIDPTGAPPRPSPTRLAHAVAFIGDTIAELLASADASADGLVLALPCPVDDACIPGPCTYGWEGESGLVPAILGRCGRSFAEVLVLNDAELTAETALARGLPAGALVLVLTLGFGPGGALVRVGSES